MKLTYILDPDYISAQKRWTSWFKRVSLQKVLIKKPRFQATWVLTWLYYQFKLPKNFIFLRLFNFSKPWFASFIGRKFYWSNNNSALIQSFQIEVECLINNYVRFISYSKCPDCCWILKLSSNFECLFPFCYSAWANQIKTKFQTCNLQTSQSISYKYVNQFWLNPNPTWTQKPGG